MGHIGLTPQSIHQLGGYKAQGKTPETARKLFKDAQILEQAGAFSIVLECVPAPLSRLIAEKLSIPVIGIGAGPDCDGEVQVVSDVLGLYSDFVPKHARQYARLAESIRAAVATYVKEVKDNTFPTMEHAYTMDESILSSLRK